MIDVGVDRHQQQVSLALSLDVPSLGHNTGEILPVVLKELSVMSKEDHLSSAEETLHEDRSTFLIS